MTHAGKMGLQARGQNQVFSRFPDALIAQHEASAMPPWAPYHHDAAFWFGLEYRLLQLPASPVICGYRISTVAKFLE